MERVQEASEEFSEIRDIISRYDTLVATHLVCDVITHTLVTSDLFQDLLERDQKNQDNIEAEKARLTRFTEEKNNEILSCNNQLAQLQTRLDRAQSKAVKWESKWAHIQVSDDVSMMTSSS